MPKLATYSTPILSNALSRALGQRSHVQQVYLSGSFPSRAAFVRAAKDQLGPLLEGSMPISRIADSGPAAEGVEAEMLLVTPKDTFTVGSDSVRLDVLAARVPSNPRA